MYKKILLLLLLITLTWLSVSKYAMQKQLDITQNKMSSIGEASKQLIATLDAPLEITVYSPSMNVLNFCNVILERYVNISSQIKVVLLNTVVDHNLAAKFKLSTEHNIVVTYKNHQQASDVKLASISEQQISTLIYRVINDTQRWIVFLAGHEETDPHNSTALGLNKFSNLLVDKGMHIASLNLSKEQEIPNNTDTLIIVNPQHALLPLEHSQIKKYLDNGGKLIWFTEPGSQVTDFINSEFGLELATGVAVDPSSLDLGSPHPAVNIITKYPAHSITAEILAPTVMPWSGHLQSNQRSTSWQQEVFLTSSAHSWLYTGPATDDLHQLTKHQGISGPLHIGIALSRLDANHVTQRVLVMADSTFIMNKYLGLYANQQLANNLVGWLQNTPHGLTFSQAAIRDFSYIPNNLDRFLFRYGFTFIFPLLLVGIGFIIQRRNMLA